MINKRLILLVCFFSLFAVLLYTQETPVQTDEEIQPQEIMELGEGSGEISENESLEESEIVETEETKEPEIVLTPEQQRVEMEIKSSTLPELAAWARSLGLSEGGTRADLARRIREHFRVPEPAVMEEDNRKILIIESAQTTEYFKIETIDEDYARLKGGVSLSLKDGDTMHKIKAEEILFNRTRNIITATGKVVYQKIESDSSIETFRGENITVNIDDWAGVFLGGSSERTLETDGTSYLFSGRVLSRSNEDVTIMDKATITTANNAEALWSISASRLWLLPGSDFAILNAVLKVGEIPILWFPFFFYPTDELIFRPVIGARTREGGFVQTTTYILGRPATDTTESSITKLLGAAGDMETERHGIFLRSTGKKAIDPNTTILKFILDYYINLGLYTGMDLKLPKLGILNSLDFSLGLGFTRTLTKESFGYTPYAPDYDGTMDWNHSNLFSYSVPFRYRMDFQSSLGGRYGNLSWKLPFYSDPYTDRDFLDRAEKMDWINMLEQGSAKEENVSEAELPPYQWSMSGSLNPNVQFMSPVVSRMSLNSISTTLDFITLRDEDIFKNNPNAPERLFFSPNRYTIYSVSGSINGAPVSLGGSAAQKPANTTSDADTTTTIREDDPLRGIGAPVPPWETAESSTETPNTGDDILRPPVLSQRFTLPSAGNLRFTFDYGLTPTSSSVLQFMNGSWKTYEDVDWSSIQTILTTVGGNGNLKFNINHSNNLFSNTIAFSGGGTWRDYTFLNEEADIFRKNPNDPESEIDETKIENTRRQLYGDTNYSTQYEYNGKLQPLYNNPIFRSSELSYSFKGYLVRSQKFQPDGEGPELTPVWGSWVKNETVDGKYVPGLTGHNLSAKITANITDQHSLTAGTGWELPPLDQFITANAGLKLWISDTRADFRWEKSKPTDTEEEEEEEEKWIFKPFTVNETVRYPNIGDLNFAMTFDPEEDYEITIITSSLSLWSNSFRTTFRAAKSKKYEFVYTGTGGRWQPIEDEPALRPERLDFSYSRNFRDIQIFPGYLGFSTNLSTSVAYDLKEHTKSNFQFTLGFNMQITNFMKIDLSASSQNNVIWRYFKNVPGMEDLTFMYIDGPQNNPIIDLFDSFNFFDDVKRQRSGFKMRNFNFTATHFLGDWNAELKVKMYTYRDDEQMPPKIKTTADVSFLVQWKPISEIKTDIWYKGDEDKWKLEK